MKQFTKFLTFSLALLLSFSLSAEEYGLASYYSDDFQGRKTASGEKYQKDKLTAAHKSLPFGTVIKITRLDNNKSVRVRVNDRGPYIKGRIVDVSRKAAESLGLIRDGKAKVKVEVVGKGKVQAKTDAQVATNTPKPKPTEYTEKKADLPPKAITQVKQAVKEAVKETTPTKTIVVPVVTEAPTTAKKPIVKTVPNKAAEPAEAKMRLVQNDYKQYDLYKIQLMRPEKTGFGVQVASLSSYENVMKKVAELQGMWYKNILVSVEKGANADSPVYKVILGPFPDIATATSYKNSMKKKNKIAGFVVGLENTTAPVK